VVSNDHEAPFHRSANAMMGDDPTAVQNSSDVHDTPSSVPTSALWCVVAWIDQPAPFQRSASDVSELWASMDPTPVHAVVDVHDTPRSTPSVAPLGVGIVWINQRTPSHRSANGKLVPVLLSDDPTALHAVVDAHDTPQSTLSVAPVGAGIGWIDQPTPSHRSTNGAVVPALSTKDPTAVQAVVDVHDTAWS
jgi:hypothetical protein